MNEYRVRAWGEELRRVHLRLREAMELATEQVEGPEQPKGRQPDTAFPDAPHRDLLVYCWGFCAALTGHHSSEDSALFPRILEDHPELAPVIANLERDHTMIAHLVADFERALRAGAPRDEQLRHLAGIEAVMETHFRYEERQLVAVLNATTGLGDDATAVLGPIA